MLKLWGRISSVNVQKVVFCLDEIGLEYERLDAGGEFGVVKTPEYMAMNPNSLVPVLEDDGAVLWESNSIVRYLCAKHSAGNLWPNDQVARAKADMWADWQLSSFTPATRDAFWGLIRTPPEKRDHAVIATSCTNSEARMDILEKHLAKHAFVGGDHFTFGDIIVGPAVHRWLNMPVERAERPHIQRWYEAIIARPSSKRGLFLPVA